MKIILKERVENLGVLGDMVTVRSGYARNFLIPFSKAVQATPINIELFEQQKVELNKAEEKRHSDAQARASLIEDKTYTITTQAGDSGKLFGSVGTKEVAEIINAGSNVSIEKRNIRMPEGVIRSLGEYDISVNLYTGINVNIKLQVIAE